MYDDEFEMHDDLDLADAVIEDTFSCPRCACTLVCGESDHYSFGGHTVCYGCLQDYLDRLSETTDEMANALTKLADDNQAIRSMVIEYDIITSHGLKQSSLMKDAPDSGYTYASDGCICQKCGLEYDRHPADEDNELLVVLCNGVRVRLASRKKATFS